MKYTILILAILFVSCRSRNETKQSTEVQTQVVEKIVTNYTDTGKIVTIREIEYRTVFDTISKTFIDVKWRVREKVSENKAITEQVNADKVTSQKIKDNSTQVSIEPKPSRFGARLALWLVIFAGIIALALYVKNRIV